MKKVFCIVALLLLSVPVWGIVYAAGENTQATGGTNQNTAETGGTGRNVVLDSSNSLNNPLDASISTIPAFFQAIIDILLVFAIPFIVFFIIYAGFLYVSARGNAETIKKAHSALLYALIGGLLILGANVLLSVITGTVAQIK